MAQGRQGSRNISYSMCNIRKQVPGNQLATTGSACVLRWPWGIGVEVHGQTSTTQTFVVTTSQVVTKCDLSSKTAWKARFLPVKWLGTEKFSLNDVPVHEVPFPGENHEISLILIPTESLHKQKRMSRLRGNELQSDRPQLCHQRASESEHQAQVADAKQPLYCYVLLETSASNGEFSLQSYLLCMEESGSYFLQAHGNKAKLKTSGDFQPTEKPRGAVILNEREHVVGFLAFNDKDEILPLFFPHNLQGDNQPFSHVEINPKTASSPLEGCSSGDDGGESQNSGTGNDSDENRNLTENLFPPSLSIKTSKKDNLEGSGDFERRSSHSKTSTEDAETGSRSGTEDPAQGLELNEQMLGNRSQPTELSYVSQTRERSGDDGIEETRRSGDGEEEEINSHRAQIRSENDPDPNSSASDDSKNDGTIEVEEVAISGRKDQETGGQLGKAPSLTRCYSEQAAMTPRTKRKFLKSHSVMAPIPLQSGALVADVIMNKVYVLSALGRHLDPTCRGIENWENLANLNDVSTDLQLKCQSQERHSRSEAMFKVLAASDPDLCIGTVKGHLRDLQINKVKDHIESLDDHMKIGDFLESADPHIPGRAFIMLDLLPDEKWKKLGVKLGVEPQDLTGIKIDCANQHQNPAEDVIEMIHASDPTMTIGQFKKHLRDIKRSDVKQKLDDLKESWTIGDLRDDLDLMRVVTSMLNGADNSRLKNYKDLADACGISSERYKYLQPPYSDSPTEVVLEEIVGRRPKFTVEELFTQLRDMKRSNVVEAISCYFVEEDMKAMKRKLKISNE